MPDARDPAPAALAGSGVTVPGPARTTPGSVGERIAARAERIVATHTHTQYQHVDHILPDEGVYDCDCNGFVGFLLASEAADLLALIRPEPGQSRPRAFVYFDLFASLPPDSRSGWRRIDRLADAQRGDVMAWRFPTIEAGEDTGHVMIVARTPVADPSGGWVAVEVLDSAATAHFDDTRAPGGGPSPAGSTGVGSGTIRMKVDGEGRPIAYLFAPPDTAAYEYREIAIGRGEAVDA